MNILCGRKKVLVAVLLLLQSWARSYCQTKDEELHKSTISRLAAKDYVSDRDLQLAGYINLINFKREHLSKQHLLDAKRKLSKEISQVHDPLLRTKIQKVVRHIDEELTRRGQ